MKIKLHPSVPLAWAAYCTDMNTTFAEYVAGFIILEGPDAVDAAAHGFEHLHARVVREAALKPAQAAA